MVRCRGRAKIEFGGADAIPLENSGRDFEGMALPLRTVARQLFLGATCSAIINQCPCATVKSHAVLTPNSSIPLTDSRAPINCTTAAAWNAIVNAMSDRPQRQLG